MTFIDDNLRFLSFSLVQVKYASRVGLLAVFPLALLLFTGLYLFVLPYAAKWGGGRGTD
jgi:hypothetical protein